MYIMTSMPRTDMFPSRIDIEVMTALVIYISLDVSVESVGSSFPRVILIGFISVEVPVAPEFPLAPIVAPPEIYRRRSILIRLGEDIPIGRLYHTHPGGLRRALTARKSVRPLLSHRLALRYTSHHLDRLLPRSSSSHSSSEHSSSRHSI
ncbi:hypothetical protein Tco_1499996 [Tanacetum coccineum]